MEGLIKLLQAMSFPTMVFVGLAIRLFVGMRQFNRRGLGGLQHFGNFFGGLVTLSIEWLLNRVAWVVMVWGLMEGIFR